MDDLIVVLLGAVLFAFVAMFAVVVAALVLAGALVGAGLWAFGAGLDAFSKDFGGSVAARGGARRLPRAPEPAFELYVLGQVFADFRHGLEHATGVLGSTRSQIAGWSVKYRKGASWPVAVGAVVGSYVGTVFAGVLGVACGVLIAVVIGVVVGVSWVLIWLMRLADSVRRRVRHASYECPTDHERFALPVYLCPACGAKHQRLVPGRWGIFKRECECGLTALPTAVITGRQRVPQQCPAGHPMSGFLGFAENLPVAIVGGPSAGKSTFLAGALVELESPDTGVYIEPLSESRDAYSRLVGAMRIGITPEKTVDEQRPALVAEVQGTGRSRALYAYDLAGEVYGAEDKVRGLRFLARSAGIVLLVDPFSIEHVAEDRAPQLAAAESRVLPSSEDPMRVYERLLATLKEAGADTHQMPLAVVIAKSDALGVQDEINAFAGAPDGGERAWLAANGAGNLVRSIEQDFNHIGWFSLSALGRMPDPTNRTPFTPRGALEPLLWILARRGIHPSLEAVTAPHTAQRLTGTAADFPAPTPRARARNASILTILGILALIGGPTAVLATTNNAHGNNFTAAAAAPIDSTQSSTSSDPNTTPVETDTTATGETNSTESSPARTNPTTPGSEQSTTQASTVIDLAPSVTQGEDFTIQRPAGNWILDRHELQKPGYVETRWHLAGQPDVIFLVDHTPGFKGTARQGAEGVSHLFTHVPSYHEIGFAAVQLPAGEGWRWEYEVHGTHSIDTFLMSCNTGYAARGAAPISQWTRYAHTLEDAISTLTPSCG